VDKDPKVLPLTKEWREYLLQYFEPFFDHTIQLPPALRGSDSHFESWVSRTRDSTDSSANLRAIFSLRIPKWYNTKMEITEIEISLVLVLTELSSIGFITGLSQEAFTRVLSLSPQNEGPIHPIILIISLLRYLDRCNDNPIIDIRKKLEDIEKSFQKFQQSREEHQNRFKAIENHLVEMTRLRTKDATDFQSILNDRRNLYNTEFEMQLQTLSDDLITLRTSVKSTCSAVEYLVIAAEKLLRASDELWRESTLESTAIIQREVYQWTKIWQQRLDELRKLGGNIEDLTREVSFLIPFSPSILRNNRRHI
jgi:hypothetical protein